MANFLDCGIAEDDHVRAIERHEGMALGTPVIVLPQKLELYLL